MGKDQSVAHIENGSVYVLQAGSHIYVKTADICAMTGKSNQWIGQLTSQGTLNKTKTPHGQLFDLIPSIQAYCEMLEERAEAGDDAESQKLEKDRRKADASIKASKAIIAGLEVKELQGKMHRSEDVTAMTEDLIFAMRNALLALPGRLSVDLAAMTDPAEVSATIQNEVYKVMEDLATYKYDSKKYEERVRARMNKAPKDDASSDEDGY